MVFLQHRIIIFVSYVHESLHNDVNSGDFIYIFLHILNQMNYTAYFDNKNVKNACFMVYFVTRLFTSCNIKLIFTKYKNILN